MIYVSIDRNNEGLIRTFTIKGHAGAGRSGEDIVCAAVSAIAYTAVGALNEMVELKSYTDRDGYMKCSIPSDLTDANKFKAQIILDSMVIGLKQVENTYKKYVSIVDEEV